MNMHSVGHTRVSRAVSALVLILIILVGCSTPPKEHVVTEGSGQGPRVELSVRTGSTWQQVRDDMLLGEQPEFRLQLSSRNMITAARFRMDEGQWQTLAVTGETLNFRPTGRLSSGTHQVAVQATDASGTVELNRTFKVDSIAPVFTRLRIARTDYLGEHDLPDFEFVLGRSAPIEIVAEAQDRGGSASHFVEMVDGAGKVLARSENRELKTLLNPASEGYAPGLYTFEVFAYDSAGNVSERYEFTVHVAEDVDRKAPSVAIRHPAGAATVDAGTELTIILDVTPGTGDISELHVLFDNVPLDPTTANENAFSAVVPDQPGKYVVAAWAVDNATPRLRSETVIREITVVAGDAPVVEVLSPVSGAGLQAGSDLSVLLDVVAGSDPVADVFVQFDGVDLVGAGRSFTGTVPVEPGEYLLTAWAVSGGSVPVQSKLAVQTVQVVLGEAPAVEILSPSAGVSLPAGSDLSVLLDVVAGSDPVADVFVQFDGVDLVGAGRSFTGTVPVEPGEYLLTAWAVSGGSVPVQSKLDYRQVTVSDAAPSVTIRNVAGGAVPGEVYRPEQEIIITLDIVNNGGGIHDDVEVTLNRVVLDRVNSSNGWVFRGTTPVDTDKYVVHATVANTAETRSSDVEHTIWVDGTPPVVSIVSPAYGSTIPVSSSSDGSGELRIQADDFGSDVERVIVERNAGGAWESIAVWDENFASSREWNLRPGGNILRAEAFDLAGNSSYSELIPVFIAGQPADAGPTVNLIEPRDGTASVEAGETLAIKLEIVEGSAVSTPLEPDAFELWLDNDLVASSLVPTVTGGRVFTFSYTVDASLNEGTYVLFVRVKGAAPSPGVSYVPIILEVE